ncbi:NAD(P)-binding protein [Trichoderma citrinoviride]|uniref:NAD(P)-binding protein n=1 Tax=Trichoderma citrinoviride TaxID=58853 RepID=A0A2T4BGZ4_9HYPO|nr:NAD(P)-binding protein [Trichoderma citrinoviride]PTB68582.1 NAD(P)-binding protein [Trichoderma citrinoviride]
MPTRNIIVTGATGRQGRAFIHALFNSPTATSSDVPNYHIWAVTRNPTSPAASSLLQDEQSHAQDITIVQGNVNNAARIKEIFNQISAEGGIFGAFIVLAYPGLGNKGDEEKRQGKMLVDLALEFKVDALVYSSTIPPGPDMDDAYEASHRSKREIELYCKGLGERGLNWTIVRPGFFMENFEGFMGSLAVGILSQGLRKETDITLVASEDIGKVAAGVFQNHGRFAHKILSITGGSLSMTEIKAAYKEVMGKQMPSVPSILAWLILKLSAGARNVVKQIERNYDVRVSGGYPTLEEEVEAAKTICELQSFRTWLLKRKEHHS